MVETRKTPQIMINTQPATPVTVENDSMNGFVYDTDKRNWFTKGIEVPEVLQRYILDENFQIALANVLAAHPQRQFEDFNFRLNRLVKNNVSVSDKVMVRSAVQLLSTSIHS